MTLSDRALSDLVEWVSGPAQGDVLDNRFELRQRIGEGGMGVVYAGYDRVDGVRVAIKIVRGLDEKDIARFEREVTLLSEVSHPAIVKCLAHGDDNGSRYLVMERLEGCNLAEKLRLGRLSVRATIELAKRIAGALVEVHKAGIVHRDLKPSNVFLVESEPSRACLLDFGIARSSTSTTLTARGALVGTPGYIAPERVRGAEGQDPASDVFSLGCVLYECLLGRPPFASETTYGLLARVLVEIAPLVRSERPEAPLGLEALVEQMLGKEPDARPDAKEVVRTLSELEAALPANAEERPELAPGFREGDVLAGKYRLERRLGDGGMGVVVAARHLELGTRVAIKLLRTAGADEGRFLREAQAASRIESEHVARVLDVGRSNDGRPFIVMEHLRGEDLAKRLTEKRSLEAATAVSYVLQACAAIGEAHSHGIVHRDIKPSNLFLVEKRDGTEIVKVLDFGISKLTQPLEGSGPSVDLTATAESSVMGSIAYMAPEQLESAAKADERSDIWSLGVVLHELVSGTRPFEGENAVAVAARIAGASPKKLERAPKGFDKVVSKCLAKKPSERYASIAELEAALEPFASATSAASSEAPPKMVSVRPKAAPAVAAPAEAPKRSMLLPVLAIAVIGGAIAFVAIRPGPPGTASTTAHASASASASASAPASASASASASAPASASASAPASASASASASAKRKPPPVGRPAASARTAPVSTPAAPSPPSNELNLRDPALEGR